jgi:hypothetical protein
MRFISSRVMLRQIDDLEFVLNYEDMELQAFKKGELMNHTIIPYETSVHELNELCINLFKLVSENTWLVVKTPFNHNKLIHTRHLKNEDEVYATGEDIARFYWSTEDNSTSAVMKRFELVEMDRNNLSNFINRVIDYRIGMY